MAHPQIIEALATPVKRVVLIKHQPHRLVIRFGKIAADEIRPQYRESQDLAHFSRGLCSDPRWSGCRGRVALYKQANFAPRRSYSAERRSQEAVAYYGCSD